MRAQARRALLAAITAAVLAGGLALVGTAGAQTTTAPDCSTVTYSTDGSGAVEVTNVSQLQCLGNATSATLGDDYVLTSDIDASGTAQWNGASGFTPVGNISAPFTGTLDGQGYTITGLSINRTAPTNVGLFGRVGTAGTVANLSLVDANVTIVDADNSVFPNAGLVAGNSDGTVRNVSVAGNVTSPYSDLGGVAGSNNGTVTRSSAAAVVSQTGGGNNAGGLVGQNTGTIVESYATGTVSGAVLIGGLVGQNDDGAGAGVVRDSYATADIVDPGPEAGGLVGQNTGLVERSYAAGTVPDPSFGDVGGLVGNDVVGAGTVVDSYWDTEATGQSTSAGGTGLTTSQLKGSISLPGFDFQTTWDVLTAASDDAVSYPFLQNNTQTPAPGREAVADCSLTLDTPGERFELGNDVIETGDVVCVEITADDVVFDGNNRTIASDTASSEPPETVGIRVTGQNVTVRNVTVAGWRTGIEVLADDATVEDATATRNIYTGIAVVSATNASLRGVEVRNSSTEDFVFSTGITLQDVTDSTVTDATVLDNQDAGLNINGVSTGNQITDVHASGNDPGIDIDSDATANDLTAITATDNAGSGLAIVGENTELTDSVASDNGGTAGVDLVSSNSGQANDTRIVNVTANRNTGDGFYLNRPTNVTLADVTARNNTNGVYFFRASGNTVRNGTFRDNTDWAVGQDEFRTLVNTVDGIDIGASTAPGTILSAEVQNARLGPTSGPPANPNATAIGRYVAVDPATPFDGTAALRNVSLAYAAGDTTDAQNLTLWVEDEGWQFVPDSGGNTTAQVVTGNVVEEIPESGTVTLGAFEFTGPYLTANITGTKGPVTAGETVTVTTTVENAGNDGDTQTVRLRYDSDGDGEPDTVADSETVTLAPGDSTTVTLSWQTTESDFGDPVALAVQTANETATDAVTVRKDADYDVAVVAGTVSAEDIADAIRAGLSDAGVLGNYRLDTESVGNVTGPNAPDAASAYDILVVNDFQAGVEGGNPLSSSAVAALYDEADSRTGIVSLDTFDQFFPVSDAIERRAESAVRGDPGTVNQSNQGTAPVQFRITQDSPLFEGVGSAGDTVDVYTAGEGEAGRAWFENFTGGQTVANVSHAGTTATDGPSVGVTDDGDEVLLTLGALGTFRASPTPAGERIIANAVQFLAPTPNVTLAPVSIDNRTDAEASTVDVTVEETRGIETRNLTVSLAIEAPNGTEVYNETLAPPALDGNAMTVTFGADAGTPELGPLAAAEGAYTATATARTDDAGPATATDQFRVVQSAPACGDVTLTETDGVFEVGTLAELQCVGDTAAGGNLGDDYALTSDIDASATAVWNGGDGFDPIGDASAEFVGTVDGQGHAISNLTIDRAGETGVGLFGNAGNFSSEFTVESLDLTNADVTGGIAGGDGKVGALVGNGFTGTIQSVSVTGTVSSPLGTSGGIDGGGVGGVAGLHNSIDTQNAYAAVTVTAPDGKGVGGFAGVVKSGSVERAVATGDVNGSRSVGGFTGTLTGGTITQSRATGAVVDSGEDANVGGFVGAHAGGVLSRTYATGNVTFDDFGGGAGGLVGVVNEQAPADRFVINRSYATGEVTAEFSDTGGLVGEVNPDLGASQQTQINDSYWDELATGQANATGVGEVGANVTGFATDDGTGRATEMLGSNAPVTMTAFDFAGTWETVADDYPRFGTSFGLSVTRFDQTVQEGEQVRVNGTVLNVGGESDTQPVTLTESVTGQSKSDSTGPITLAPGEQAQFSLAFDTGAGDAGAGPVTVASGDDAVTRSVTVEGPAESSLSGLNIAGQGTSATITEGDSERVAVNVTNTGDQTGSFDVSLGIGTAVTETQTTGALAAGASETVLFEAVAGGLQPDDYEVNVSTSDDSVNGSLTVEQPATGSLSTLDVAGQGTDATITQGSNDSVAVTLTNTGDQFGSFGVSLDIGAGVSETQSVAEVGPGTSQTVTFENVTGGLQPGDYDVNVSTSDDSLNGSLTVEQPATAALDSLTIADSGANATVTNGTDANVTVAVTNAGDQQGTFDATLTIADGTPAVTETATVTLEAGTTRTLTFENVTGGLAVGQYNVTVTAGTATASGTLSVVEPPTPATFLLSNLSVPGGRVVVGSPVTISATVTNVGEVAGTQAVTLSLDGLTRSREVALASGANDTLAFANVDTGALGTGIYTPELATANDTTSGNLTVSEPLFVTDYEVAPSVRLDQTLTVDATVRNIDTEAGNLTVPLRVDGATVDSETVQVGANQTTQTTLSWDPEFGTANVTVAALTPTLVRVVGPDVNGNGRGATDTTDDGLLNDVNGDREYDILDVQVLFRNLLSPAVSENSRLFNFQTIPGLSVLDVQELFNGLGEEQTPTGQAKEYLEANNANNYTGTVRDRTGQQSVTIQVGAGVNGLAFNPAAVRVSPGTTVTWEWTGAGGAHNVVGDAVPEGGTTLDSGSPVSEQGITYSATLDTPGAYRYYCGPHRAIGMYGAVIVE